MLVEKMSNELYRNIKLLYYEFGDREFTDVDIVRRLRFTDRYVKKLKQQLKELGVLEEVGVIRVGRGARKIYKLNVSRVREILFS